VGRNKIYKNKEGELIKQKIILGCNKNYTILALNCILINSKVVISVSEIEKRNRKNNRNEE